MVIVKEKPVIERIKSIVKEELPKQKKQSIAHQFDHFERVRENAVKIAKSIEAKQAKQAKQIDFESLSIAAFLHDIVEPFDNKQNHVELSLKKAKQILQQVNYPAKKIQKVLELINSHSSENNFLPKTIEAKILFDADKLDGLGAIGITRMIAFGAQNNWPVKKTIQWYEPKVAKAIPRMQTGIGKQLAEKELVFVQNFLKKIKTEL